MIWLDEQTLLVGRGYRTNDYGIHALQEALPEVSVLAFDLPHLHGSDVVLHRDNDEAAAAIDVAAKGKYLIRAQAFAEYAGNAKVIVPQSDTGSWSLYSLGGRESDLGYHRLVRDFLDNLCDRTRTPVYCKTAKKFTDSPLPPIA